MQQSRYVFWLFRGIQVMVVVVHLASKRAGERSPAGIVRYKMRHSVKY